MTRACWIVLIVALAASAQAEVIVEVTPLDAFTVLGGPAHNFEVALVASETADIVTAIDLAFTGPVYQIGLEFRDNIITTPTETDATNTLVTPIIRDSHFLPTFVAAVTAPNETNTGQFGPNAFGDTEGLGALQATTGLAAVSQMLRLVLANIVLLDGQSAQIVGAVSNPLGAKTNLDEDIGPIPEPASMVLLAVGAMGLLRRRTR